MRDASTKRKFSRKASGDKESLSKDSIATQLCLLITGVIAMCIGATFIRERLRERDLGQESLSWQQTEGVVTRCEYRVGSRQSRSATIAYEYAVEGKAYRSEKITVTSNYTSQNPKEFAHEHPEGAKTTVYYKGDDPSTSVLIPGIEKENTVMLVLFGSLMVLLSACTAVSIFKTLRLIFFQKSSPSHA